MSTRGLRRFAATSARVIVGAAIAGGVVVAVGVGVAAPWPGHTALPVSIAAPATASDTVLACTGALLAQARDSSQASVLTTAANQSLTVGVAPESEPLEQDALEAISVVDDDVVARLRAEPLAVGEASDIAGSGSATVSADDLRGFAASACRAPLMDSWLVGGSASTGASDLIILANPGEVPATVQLTVYGATGELSPAGGTDVVVAPGSQLVLPLAGIALNEASPVVRVTASGAPITASLQTSITRTLVPGGIDQVGAIAATSATQVISGVPIDAQGSEGVTTSVVRVLAPQSDGVAIVSVTDALTGKIAIEREVPLTGAIPVQVDISDLPVGDYAVTVAADTPVVAAVWHATGVGEGADIGWFSAAPALSTPSVFAVPAGPAPTLVVTNSSEVDAQVYLSRAEGQTDDAQTVEIAPGEASIIPLEDDSLYVLDANVDIYASVVFSGEGAVSGYSVWPQDAAVPDVVVYP